MVEVAVRVQSLALTWQLLALADDRDDESQAKSATILGQLVNEFAQQLQTIGDERVDEDSLADVAVRAQADLYMVFDSAKLQVRLLCCPHGEACCAYCSIGTHLN